MKKYYLSHIDFSEVINVTADEQQIERAKARMTELRLLTDKGNPSPATIAKMTENLSRSFLNKLEKRLSRRDGGIYAVKETLEMLYERNDYYGFFLYVAFLYGFLEWQVPESIMLLPAVPDALKCYCSELLVAFYTLFAERGVSLEDDKESL